MREQVKEMMNLFLQVDALADSKAILGGTLSLMVTDMTSERFISNLEVTLPHWVDLSSLGKIKKMNDKIVITNDLYTIRVTIATPYFKTCEVQYDYKGKTISKYINILESEPVLGEQFNNLLTQPFAIDEYKENVRFFLNGRRANNKSFLITDELPF